MADEGIETGSAITRALLAGVAVDVSLVIEAGAMRLEPVTDWLVGNEALLLWTLGPLHVLLVPMLLLLPVAWETPAHSLLFGDRQSTLEGKLYVGAAVGALCLGFLVPILGMAASFDPGVGWVVGIAFGPLLVLFGLGWLLVKLDKEGKGTLLRMSALQSLAFTAAVWLYLSELEAILFIGASDRSSNAFELMVTLGVFLGYPPIRMLLYWSRSTSRFELITMAVAFIVLVGRVTATLQAGA